MTAPSRTGAGVRRLTVHGDERRAEEVDRPMAELAHEREMAARDDQCVGRVDDVADHGVAAEHDAVRVMSLGSFLLAGKRAGAMADDQHLRLPDVLRLRLGPIRH
jgi:hypothetical protein